MYEIEKYNPCEESIKFRSKFDSFQEAWNKCPRGDWMLWIARRLNIDNQLLTLCKAYCAKTVYHLMKDDRSKNAIIVAINYGRGLATKEELSDAADAAYAAADAADAAADAAAYAADAAAYAKEKNRKKTADICRKYLTKAVFEKLNLNN